MGVVKSLITGRHDYHRGAVVRVRSGDRVMKMKRPLNRLYPVEVESQVREERQNRNTDFPVLPSWEMLNRNMLVNFKIKSRTANSFAFIYYFIRFVVD